MQSRNYLFLGLGIAVLATVLGCSSSNRLNRQAVSGKVTLNGTPIKQGTIEFCPQQERGSTTSGAIIKEGAYTIKTDKGLPPGTYTVKIYASWRDPSAVDNMPGPMTPPATQLIPVCYNIHSKLTAEIKAEGPNNFDFELRSN